MPAPLALDALAGGVKVPLLNGMEGNLNRKRFDDSVFVGSEVATDTEAFESLLTGFIALAGVDDSSISSDSTVVGGD